MLVSRNTDESGDGANRTSMNYSKVDPGPPDWTFAIYAFITIAVVLFAWKALRSPSRPT
jgi:hypothetical protein